MVSGFTSTFATVAITTKVTSLIPICADFVLGASLCYKVCHWLVAGYYYTSLPARIGHQKNIVENVIKLKHL